MVESHLVGGAQKFTPGKDKPQSSEYGKSITDACIGWNDSMKFWRFWHRPCETPHPLKFADWSVYIR